MGLIQILKRKEVLGVIGTLILIGTVTFTLVLVKTNRNYNSEDDMNSQLLKMTSGTQVTQPEWKTNIRLEPGVRPLHYDLYLYPKILEGTFNGTVTIELVVGISVNHIRIHKGKSLTVTGHSLQQVGSGPLSIPTEALEYPVNDYLVLKCQSLLEIGNYTLEINFGGKLVGGGIIGLYRSHYFEPTDGAKKYVVTTKFQPTYARRAFPCFDEPSFKSTFTISLIRPADLAAFSNMPMVNELLNQPMTGMITTIFAKSPPMVSYLVMVAIGDFDCELSHTSRRSIPVRVCATKVQQKDKLKYASAIAPKMVDFYETYFGIDYSLPKLDIIAFPEFISGAMEHWGALSFRESSLLYSNLSTASNKQRIATVLAHELVHCWFGNLVTLQWWSDLWLNEGFASYLEYKGVNYVHPEWNIYDQFVTEDLIHVLDLDGKQSSHPIVQTVTNPDQITEIFDTISYTKGASVLRMLEQYLGEMTFQKGVHNFLKSHSYRTAQNVDLWNALQAASQMNVDIAALMETWINQKGYPVLQVLQDSSTSGKLRIQQTRFLEDRNTQINKSDSAYNYKWDIPLEITFTNEDLNTSMTKLVINRTQNIYEIPVSTGDTLSKLNPGYYGYYRINYPESTWAKINVNYLTFSPRERCAFIEDIFVLSTSNYISYNVSLKFAMELASERHLVPWICAISHLKHLSSIIRQADSSVTYTAMKVYVQRLTSALYNTLSWTDQEDEHHVDRLLKLRILALSCSHEYMPCLRQVKRLFNDWLDENIPVPSSLRPIVYKWGMRQATADNWDQVWSIYLRATDAHERTRLLSCLASTAIPAKIHTLLKHAQNETLIRRQDFFTVTNSIADNPIGNPILWTFFRNEYDNLVHRFTLNDRYFGRMISSITYFYSADTQLDEILTFFKRYPQAGAGQRARSTSLERVRNNIRWVEQYMGTVAVWLRENIH